MSDRKSSMLPTSSQFVMPSLDMATSGQRLYEKQHTDATNRAFADAFAANFPQGPAAKRDGLVRVLVEQGMPFDQAEAQADEMLAASAPAQVPAAGSQMLPISKPADLGALGRDGDTMVAHINPEEADLLKRSGGSGTINPATGLPEFGGGGGTINGAGGSGNVSGGGRGNAGGGGAGNRAGKSVDRVNSQPGTQQASWGNRMETPWGAPFKTDNKWGVPVALGPKQWAAWTDQVDDYNAAAHKWNTGAAQRSLANLINNMSPMGFSMQAPDINKPKTYVGGDFHLGVNPAEFAAGMIGGALVPGGGIPAGFIGGKLYEAAGLPNVMLGGGAVPKEWDPRGAQPADKIGSQADSSSAGVNGQPGGSTGNGAGLSLLPPISGAPQGQPPVVAPPGSLLPPITAPKINQPGAYLPIAGPTPYGWRRPAWAA